MEICYIASQWRNFGATVAVLYVGSHKDQKLFQNTYMKNINEQD